MNEVCKLLKIDQKFSAPYHHQSIGTLERNHRVMNEYMLNFVDDLEWDKWIPYYTFAYNTTPHVNNNYSPFELVYGKLPTLPNDKLNNNNKIYNLDDYANELIIRLSRALSNARNLIELYIYIYLARTPEIGQGLGRILSCGARKPEQTYRISQTQNKI